MLFLFRLIDFCTIHYYGFFHWSALRPILVIIDIEIRINVLTPPFCLAIFTLHIDEVEKLFFRSSEEVVLYDISMEFYYREQHPGQPMTTKKVSWSYGSKTLSEYEKAGESIYSLDYSVNTLFNALSNAIGGDTIWDVNHPNVTRYIDDFVIVMVAAGREFYENYQMILESGNVHSNSAYSNINGGYGLFSSRVKISRTAELSSTTKRDIFGMKSWGFHEE